MRCFDVLLVDDEEEYVKTLAERLKMRRLNARIALSGEEAMGLIQDSTPDVIVLDWKMPGMDGMVVLSRAKKLAPQVPVIMVIGHGSQKDEEAARRLGAFDYLQKPVDLPVLLKSMQEACGTEDKETKP